MKLQTLYELVDLYHDTQMSSRDVKKLLLTHLMSRGMMDVDELFTNVGNLVQNLAEDLQMTHDDVYEALSDMFQYAEVVADYPKETRLYSYDIAYSTSNNDSDSTTDNSDATVVDPSNFKYQVKNGMRDMYMKMTSLEGMTCLNLAFTIASMMLSFIGIAFTSKLMTQ